MGKHSIGKTIANLRKTKGWTQVDLAERLNVSDKAVSKWESEAGLPEISQLPTLASLFDVTIDYIMTGKDSEKEVIAISKAELCAKTDDVSLAKKAKNLPKDEKGKTIVDYILKYRSLKVFKLLCETDARFITRFRLLDAIILATLANSLCLLSGKEFCVENNYKFTFKNEDDIKSLLPVEDESYFKNYQNQYICILPRSYFKMIVTDKRINETTLNTLFSNQNSRKCVWYHAFPYIIEEAYKKGNKTLLHKLMELSVKNNSVAYDTIEPVYDCYECSYNYLINYFFVANKYSQKGHGLVRILESTIKYALSKGDFESVRMFNELNNNILAFFDAKFHQRSVDWPKCYIASEDEIRVEKLKLDKSVSETDLQIQSALHNGIISIHEVSEVKDFAAIKKALYQYPIHPFELLYKWYQKKEWGALFRFAIDTNENELADFIIAKSKDRIEEKLFEFWTKEEQKYNHIKRLDLNINELYPKQRNAFYSTKVIREQTNIQEVNDYLSQVRQRIIDELANKLDKERIVGDLTKDYFYEELDKGNREIVIIKLCVRLEALLKCDYHYEGDFSEMLDCFCQRFNTTNDEGNNYNPDTPKLLNDLRKQRNDIVHSEKSLPPMPDGEIKQCIEYICAL